MAYERKLLDKALIRRSNAFDTAEDISAAAAVYGGYICMSQVQISRFMFCVTTAIVAVTTAPVVRITRRPTIGSSSGEVEIARLTLPTGTAAGKVVYKDVSPVTIFPGEEISLEHVTQAVGSAAGAGFYGFEAELDPEYVSNQSKMLASS